MARKWIALGLIAGGLLGPAGLIQAQQPWQPLVATSMAGPGPAGMLPAPPGSPGADPSCMPPPMGPEQGPPGPGDDAPGGGCANPDCGTIAWLGGEWLGFRLKKTQIPFPLVTSGATILVNAGPVPYHDLNGGRLDWGVWFSPDRVLGMEFTGFGLESATREDIFNSNANGVPPLSVVGAAVATPGVRAGRVTYNSDSRLWGGEALFDSNAWGPLTLFTGFRYVREEDTLDLSSVSRLIGVVPITTTFISDHFSTRNSFYGYEVGARFAYNWGAFWIGAQAKAAIGQTHQVATARGTTTVAVGNLFPVTTPVSRLVTPANSGSVSRNTDGFIPEGQIKIGYQLTRNMSISAGYDYIYWNRVIRASELLNLNTAQPLAPIERSFWAQGITAGLEFDY